MRDTIRTVPTRALKLTQVYVLLVLASSCFGSGECEMPGCVSEGVQFFEAGIDFGESVQRQDGSWYCEEHKWPYEEVPDKTTIFDADFLYETGAASFRALGEPVPHDARRQAETLAAQLRASGGHTSKTLDGSSLADKHRKEGLCVHWGVVPSGKGDSQIQYDADEYRGYMCKMPAYKGLLAKPILPAQHLRRFPDIEPPKATLACSVHWPRYAESAENMAAMDMDCTFCKPTHRVTWEIEIVDYD